MNQTHTQRKPLKKRQYTLSRALRAVPVVLAVAVAVAMFAPGIYSGSIAGIQPHVYAGEEGVQGSVGGGTVTDSCHNGKCIVRDYINPLVVMLNALVGVSAAISFIYAGIQYASSADSSQKVSQAKSRMVKTVFVVGGYLVFLAFLRWVLPGGLNPTGP